MATTVPRTLPLDVALQEAVAHHQAGRLREAERLYRSILQVQPGQPDANHNLGVLAMQVGQHAAGLPYLKTARTVNPSIAQYSLSYAETLLATGQAGEALNVLQSAMQRGLDTPAAQSLRQRAEAAALNSAATGAAPPPTEISQLVDLFNAARHAELETRARMLTDQYPDYGFVWMMLGASLKMQGKNAVPALRKAVELLPEDAEAHNNLGIALKTLGQLDDAVASYRRALEIKPENAAVHNNLANALKDLGQLDDAVASYRRALQIQPDFAEAHGNLGNTLRDLGQLDDAVACYRRALEIKPGYADAHSNLGNAFRELGQLDDAVASYRRALEIKPEFAEAHNNLANALRDLGRRDDAVASYRRALQIKPDFAEAHSNLGNELRDLRQLREAVASYRRALEIKPDFAEAHSNLGIALHALGQLDDAVASYRRALEIKPDHTDAYSNLLYLHASTRDISPELECSLAANWENIALGESERVAARNRSLSIDDSFARSPRGGRKLKIGVVSAEIGQHPVAEFLEPFLEQFDRSRFHVTLFPTTARQESRAARLRELVSEFKPLVGIPDNKAADAIRADRIDVLIDTTSHMHGCRLGIFAHRAAPVQCHYIGYHGTTGLTEMDWFIADEVLLPSSCDAHFRERIWRLPRLWISYRGDASLPVSRWAPSLDGTVWLGTFNNLTKVREDTLALWAKVMHAIPESKLFLKDRKAIDRAIQDRIRTTLHRHGIGARRVEFAGEVSDWRSHMAMYDRLDIALDPIPLNSGTTAFDALWMGVPLVGLEGNWMGGRMTEAILKALGKPEWVAQNEDEYVAIVAALARDVEGRRSLRATQRALMLGSPLCDAQGLARALEDAFTAMFDQWAEKRESGRLYPARSLDGRMGLKK